MNLNETTKILNGLCAQDVELGVVVCSAASHNLGILQNALPNLDRATRDNVNACIADAQGGIMAYLDSDGAVHPDWEKYPSLANCRAVSAYLWADRAASHAFGFSIPSDWVTVAGIVGIVIA